MLFVALAWCYYKNQYHFTMEYTSHRPKQCPGGEIKENSCERKDSEWPVLV
jgi:hypothetical protein